MDGAIDGLAPLGAIDCRPGASDCRALELLPTLASDWRGPRFILVRSEVRRRLVLDGGLHAVQEGAGGRGVTRG